MRATTCKSHTTLAVAAIEIDVRVCVDVDVDVVVFAELEIAKANAWAILPLRPCNFLLNSLKIKRSYF